MLATAQKICFLALIKVKCEGAGCLWTIYITKFWELIILEKIKAFFSHLLPSFPPSSSSFARTLSLSLPPFFSPSPLSPSACLPVSLFPALLPCLPFFLWPLVRKIQNTVSKELLWSSVFVSISLNSGRVQSSPVLLCRFTFSCLSSHHC